MGTGQLAEAFDKLEFLVVIDIYPSATSEYADYVLPTDMFSEQISTSMTRLQKGTIYPIYRFRYPPRSGKPNGGYYVIEQHSG